MAHLIDREGPGVSRIEGLGFGLGLATRSSAPDTWQRMRSRIGERLAQRFEVTSMMELFSSSLIALIQLFQALQLNVVSSNEPKRNSLNHGVPVAGLGAGKAASH